MSVRELTGVLPVDRSRLGEALERANRLIAASTPQRQIPADEMLAISKALDRMPGLMIHFKV